MAVWLPQDPNNNLKWCPVLLITTEIKMNLLIWRHADAAPGEPDAARPLTVKGINDARKISRWIKEHVPGPYLVLCSPAQRTRQTAAALDVGYDVLEALAYDRETSANVLTSTGWPAATGTVILVGHQPFLGRLNAMLLTGQERNMAMERGSLWWFSSASQENAQTGALLAVISPNLL